jgi:hypothetical protein
MERPVFRPRSRELVLTIDGRLDLVRDPVSPDPDPAKGNTSRRSAEMHYFQSMIATDIVRERIRDAAQQRLADEARRGRGRGRPGLAARLTMRLAAVIGQLRFRPSTAADARDCA